MIPNRKRKYYVLAIWHKNIWEDEGKWGVEFGSYVRAEVEEEKQSMAHTIPRGHLRVVCCPNDRQNVITATVESLGKPR